jgi:hypothetical protein
LRPERCELLDVFVQLCVVGQVVSQILLRRS